MFIVYYKNVAGKIIRPTPFVSINYNINRNKEQSNAGDYTILLTGVLLANSGSPQDDDSPDNILNEGPNYEDNESGDYERPDKQIIDFTDRAYSIFRKQQALRALFAHDGQKMEFSSIRNDDPMMYFYPSLESISFDEGTYVDLCRYTITLRTPIIFTFGDEKFDLSKNLDAHIEDYSDNWSIEVDEGFGKTQNPFTLANSSDTSSIVPRVYRLTRSVSAVGKVLYEDQINTDQTDRYEAWEQARKFVKTKILNESINDNPTNTSYQFPGLSSSSVFASGFLNIPSSYGAFNHLRAENIDKTNGSYALTDTWILSPENAIENYDMSISKSLDSPITTVSINGNIKGLSNSQPHEQFNNINKYNNALSKLNVISNNGLFGLSSSVYRRANKTAQNIKGVILNHVPLSLNVTHNNFTGEINYSVSYDDRPSNLFPDFILKENITITDTYPGDVYSIVPVLNRLNGPILQYIGGRTEYQRSLNIELIIDRDYIHFKNNSPKETYIYSKPSMNPLVTGILQNIINECKPSQEPNIRKYFLNPVSENWDAKNGSYSVQISWVYELET